MARIKIHCPTCGKIPQTIKETPIGRIALVTLYPCKHVTTKDKVQAPPEDAYEAIRSIDGEWLFPYQIEGIRKAELADLRFLCFDDMGTGKSIFAAALLRLHPEMFPCLIITKARLRIQWFKVLVNWGPTREGLPTLIPQILQGTRDRPDFALGQVVITSYDSLFARVDKETQYKRSHWMDKETRFKSIIMDEFQLIKNSASQRTTALMKFAGTVKYVIGLSGTPVLNDASEFFCPGHITRPDLIKTQSGFNSDWVATYVNDNGAKKKAGILKHKQNAWKEFIEPWTIRRTFQEVWPDLPKVFRQFKYVELDKTTQKKYNELNEEFMELYEEYDTGKGSKFSSFAAVQECMMRMRHLVGDAKVDWVVGEVEDFLDETDRKLAVYRHHDSVGNMLNVRLSALCESRSLEPPVYVDSSMGADEFDRETIRFVEGNARLFIARTLAEGEGLNLQACSDVINCERAWNPGKEEQVEKRFLRVGSSAERINSVYPIALGTIDEFLTKMVEHKRRACASTYGHSDIAWDEAATLQDLAKELMTRGRKAWSMA